MIPQNEWHRKAFRKEDDCPNNHNMALEWGLLGLTMVALVICGIASFV